MIDRQTIIDAIQDLQESISHGSDFDTTINEIAAEYRIPTQVIVANIERVETLEAFRNRNRQSHVNTSDRERIFAPLKEHLEKVYTRQIEPVGAPLGTIVFIQRTFDRQLWPAANAYARQYVKTLRIQRGLQGTQSASN